MSNSVRDYEKLAVDIVNAVGGKENIVKAARCATRLRLVLKETPKDAHKKVSELTGVITVVENNLRRFNDQPTTGVEASASKCETPKKLG